MTQKQIGLNLAGLAAVVALLAGGYWQATGARAVPALIESLRDERAKVRSAAARALGQIGPDARPAAPALLERALHDDDHAGTLAAAALKTIDLTAARQVMTAWLPQLGSGDTRTRRQACEVLASLGPVAKPAVPRLVETLRDEDDVVRNCAVRALGSIGIPAVLVAPALVAALDDRAMAVRYTAALQFAFGQTPAAAIPALTRRAGDAEKSVAGLAALALAGAERKQMANVSVLAMTLRTGSGREYPLLALAKLGPQAGEAVPALIEVLNDPRAFDRYLAAEALGAIGPSAAAARPALEAALRDEDAVVRESAAGAIEAIVSLPSANRAAGSR